METLINENLGNFGFDWEFKRAPSEGMGLSDKNDEAEVHRFFYTKDQVGSSSYISDAGGLPHQFIGYMPFGNSYTDIRIEAKSTNYRFTGKEQDMETGLYYYGARYYDFSRWSDLASFFIPQDVNDRVTSLGWTNQDIEMGNTKQVNLDYHSVSISSLPDINGDGVGTVSELFSEIRLNFPNYADGETTVPLNNGPDFDVASTWSFYENDFDILWSTDFPLKTVVEIDTESNPNSDIPSGLTDDATVICSSYSDDCCWVFSTIWVDQIGNTNNGSHPVSGNRQFGIKQLDNGDYQFYVKAADRGRINWLVKGLSWMSGNNSTKIFYQITDDTWNGLTDNIAAMLNSANPGSATKNAPVIFRPDWDAVKNQLKLNSTLDSVPCE